MEGRLFASSAARWSPEGTAALPALAEQHNKGGGPQTVLRAWLQRPIDNFSAHTWNRSPLQDDKGSIIWRLFGSRVAKIDQYSDAGRLHPRNRDDGWKIDAVTCKWFSAEAVFTVSYMDGFSRRCTAILLDREALRGFVRMWTFLIYVACFGDLRSSSKHNVLSSIGVSSQTTEWKQLKTSVMCSNLAVTLYSNGRWNCRVENYFCRSGNFFFEISYWLDDSQKSTTYNEIRFL